jgi:hypothetical protein
MNSLVFAAERTSGAVGTQPTFALPGLRTELYAIARLHLDRQGLNWSIQGVDESTAFVSEMHFAIQLLSD